MSFNVALSGLNAASTDLNVTGNNIANVATTGFKSSRAEFQDVYLSSMLGSGQRTAGSGATSSVSQQMTGGNINSTGRSLDLAIDGGGYFITRNGGDTYYTRAGNFYTDKEGYVTNSQGDILQGYTETDASGNIIPGQLRNLKVDASGQPATATSTVTGAFTLNSSATAITADFDPKDSSTYNWSTSSDIYDSLGNTHSLMQYFVKDANNAWTMYSLVNGQNPANPASSEPSAVRLSFDPSGNLDNVLQRTALDENGDGEQDVDIDGNLLWETNGVVDAEGNPVDAWTTVSTQPTLSLGTWTPAVQQGGAWIPNGATSSATTDGQLMFNLANTRQTNSTFGINSSGINQDGWAAGQLSGLSVDESGKLFATYTNGQSKVIGQAVLASFTNEQGLASVSGTKWRETFASGEPANGVPGSGLLGGVQAGALEDSNVDLTAELVRLIIAQRNYQANAKTIETESAISQTIINLR
ncbi:flagellar hook protein FlgE [Stutzerimonas azotifigens]|uniref:flagellar hook protein FlgE n=1 Tax=Stutzerimonas azotifigens TaxID=291995 RepID=UPI0003F9B6AF|nr:flagellar hook protein FlgE [Stutzerimonas azotifigens]